MFIISPESIFVISYDTYFLIYGFSLNFLYSDDYVLSLAFELLENFLMLSYFQTNGSYKGLN